MHLTEIPQLKSATPEEKIALIDELWASIADRALPTPDSHLSELDRRVADFARNPAKALTPQEARDRIRTRTGL